MRRPSNSLALAVLALLTERPMHPYEISNTLRNRHIEQSIRVNYGSLYSVVESLAKKDLIEVKETVREGRRPERTIYQITDRGIGMFTQWLSDMLSVPTPQFTDFEAALALMAELPPDEVVALLRRRLEDLRHLQVAHQAVLADAPASFPRLFLIESEYQAALREAEATFVEQLVADLENDDLSGLQIWRRLHELRSTDTPPEEIDATITAEFTPELDWMRPETG